MSCEVRIRALLRKVGRKQTEHSIRSRAAWSTERREPKPAVISFSQRTEQRLSFVKHSGDKAGLKQFPFAVRALEGEAQLGHQDMGCFSVIPEGQGCCEWHQGAALLLVPHPAAKIPHRYTCVRRKTSGAGRGFRCCHGRIMY